MRCTRCGHALEWEEAPGFGLLSLRVTDSHLVIDRPRCVPWWHHEVFDPAAAARAIIQAMNESCCPKE